MSVVVYVVDGCPYCELLLADLQRRRVVFRLVNLSAEPQRLEEVVALTWECRVPVVVDHERVTVGFGGGSSEVSGAGRRRV
ncbi:MAG: glutaredoxin family protein [Thermoanaerobaculaceae bacterium]|nr:glutaredoxin family protein [Thermoanaerobaculaceae bacterium]